MCIRSNPIPFLFLLLLLIRISVSEVPVMIIVLGTPDASTSTATDETSVSWSECVDTCYATVSCFMVYRSGDGLKQCVSYGYKKVSSIAVSDQSVGDKVAMKISQDDTECLESAEERFDNSSNVFFSSDGESSTFRVYLTNDVYSIVFQY